MRRDSCCKKTLFYVLAAFICDSAHVATQPDKFCKIVENNKRKLQTTTPSKLHNVFAMVVARFVD